MKTFSQFSEAFNAPYKIDMVSFNDRDYKGKAKLKDGSELVVYADRERVGVANGDEKYSWDITFKRSGSVDVTGEGDQMKVFATVIDAVQQFIKKQDPEEFSFTADKASYGAEIADPKKMQSREKLYGRLVKKYFSKGYKVHQDTNTLGTAWIIKKQKAVKKRRHKSRL